jgi:hypothetical protein
VSIEACATHGSCEWASKHARQSSVVGFAEVDFIVRQFVAVF